jgi:hypothetical protein
MGPLAQRLLRLHHARERLGCGAGLSGTAMDRHSEHAKWSARILGCALLVTWAPDGVSAQGLFDFLFGNSQPRDVAPPPVHPPPPVERPGRIAPAPLGQENVNEGGGSTGHGVAFCVRLCDGHHFPLEQMVKGNAAETCRASCPYSRTKVFFGAEIDNAVAPDGQHYASLDTAFLYRKQLVASCTCNGKDAFGLAPFDVPIARSRRPMPCSPGLC